MQLRQFGASLLHEDGPLEEEEQDKENNEEEEEAAGPGPRRGQGEQPAADAPASEDDVSTGSK
jgi:hypothetical protein